MEVKVVLLKEQTLDGLKVALFEITEELDNNYNGNNGAYFVSEKAKEAGFKSDFEYDFNKISKRNEGNIEKIAIDMITKMCFLEVFDYDFAKNETNEIIAIAVAIK